MIPGHGEFIHHTALLVLRFAGDVESDSIFAPHSVGLRNCLCARFLKGFFEDSMTHVEYEDQHWWESGWEQFYAYANFVAHLVNLGHVWEPVICGHIL